MGVGTRFIASHRAERGGQRDHPTPPLGRDKSGPYAILATLVQLGVMRIGHKKLAPAIQL